MRVKTVYMYIHAGALSGMPAIRLSPDGKSEQSLVEVMQLLREEQSSMNIKMPILCFDSRDVSVPEEELGSWVKLLDWALTNGFYVVHYIKGTERPSYVRMGGIIKTFITDDEWLKFPTNEVHWLPQSKEAAEPEGVEGANRYVHLTKAIDQRWLIDFAMSCEKAWAIVMPPKKTIEVILHE